MDFQFWPAVVAGFVGGVAMSILMRTAQAAGVTGMEMAVIEGAFVTDDAGKARGIGMFMHLVVMSGVIIGSIYALLFAAFFVPGGDAWLVGALFGIAHGVIAGVMMRMLPVVHPRMSVDGVAPAAASGSGVELHPPGMFARNYGAMTPMALMVSHIVYGVVVGAVYASLA